MKIIGALFCIYRLVLSPAIQLVFNVRCRYEESCSEYTERMIREQGLRAGMLRGLKRIASCNPWSTRRVHG